MLYSKEVSKKRTRETARQLSSFKLAIFMGRCERLSSLLSLMQWGSQSSSSGFAFVDKRKRRKGLKNAN